MLLLSISCAGRQAVPESSQRQALSGPGQAAPTAQVLTEKVIDAVVQRRIFEITPETVTPKMDGLVTELKKGAEREGFLEFTGQNAASGVSWARVEFQQAEPGSKVPWELLQIHIALTPPDSDRQNLFQNLISQFSAQLPKLGKVKRIDSAEEKIWSLSSNRQVSLSEGMQLNPITDKEERAVLVLISIPQGDSEEE